MGAHSFLHVGDLWIFTVRESYSEELAALFTDDQADPRSDTAFYSSTAAVTRDRLSCLGITPHAARAAISQREREMERYMDRIGDELEPFEVWVEAASIEATGGPIELGEAGEPPEWTSNLDPRVLLRPLVDRLPPDLPVELNLTEIVGREWAPVDPRRCVTAMENVDTPGGRGPMIVMTEGSTDAAVITGAIQVLAPHLMGYLRVLDYTFKPEGGAPALVRGIRAFAAAGVRNNIVALFDNDAAAASALRPLRGRALPKNFRVVTLPELDIARTYPTSGPSGLASRDVNGDAVAIEMFFGEDVLRTNGTLTPVLWRGWMDGVDRYQGELANKPELWDRFNDKVAVALATGINSYQDWAPLRLLLDRIVGAFDDAAGEAAAKPKDTAAP